MTQKTGKIYLVGAGPGDPGLLTLKGRQVLSQADVVVYDALVGPGVLAMIPKEAKVYDAGKHAGDHTIPQEEMNRILVCEAQAGKTVVRLKGGDPFVFGRGGEELELPADCGIPFEVVPGVTSAFAVPAYNGIPVTHRDYASSVHVITGHKKKDEPLDIDFEALVRAGGTDVFLMGVSTLPLICNGMLAAGLDPQTPAAILERGTTAGQRHVIATVSTLEEGAKAAGIGTPAIIVVGEVCALADRFAWAEQKPLAGFRVVLTRPRELISQMAQLLRNDGAEVIELPAIRTVSAEPQTQLEEALSAPFDWLVFTSPSGVRIFFDRYLQDHDMRDLSGVRIAAIGKGTSKALRERGLRADFLPSVYDTETLGRELARQLKPGDRVLIPRARLGSPALTDALSAVPGVEIRDIPVYDTVYEKSGVIDVKKLFETERIDAAVFTSASTVRGFAAAAEGLDFTGVRAVCIGKQTQVAADALGMQTYVACEATLEALLEKVRELAGVPEARPTIL